MNKLIDRIKQAFTDVEYPGDDNLTDSTYGDEPAALVREFSGRTNWQVLDAAFLDQAPEGWGSALSFFSYSALRFYLPAYLVADIRGDLQCADPATRLCLFVTPLGEKKRIAKVWGGGSMGEHSREGFSCFDANQVAAVVAYLWWKLESLGGYDPTIEQALENYWLVREAAGC